MDREQKVWVTVGAVAIGVLVLTYILGAVGGITGNVTKGASGITIGAIMPLTGDIAFIGQNIKSGIELAVEEINAAGGVNGESINVIFEDGQCGPKEATNAANKLVNVDGVPVIIGGACSSETLAAAPIAEEGKVVMISPASSSPDITDAGHYIFRDYPSDAFQGKVGADFAFNDLGAKRVAVLSCLSDYCAGIAEVFAETYTGLGGQITDREEFEQGSTDLRTQLTKIKTSNPDLIYFISYTQSAVTGLKQIRELGIDANILSADSWDDPTIVDEAGVAAEGIHYTAPFTPLTNEFETNIAEKIDGEVTVGTAQAYDAVYILAEVMKDVGTDGDAIRDALYKIQDYEGVSGTIGFDSNGDLAEASYVLKVVNSGQTVETKQI